MGVIKTEFEGLHLFEPRVFEDERGYFFESYNANLWKEAGVNIDYVQDNESKSSKGTIRGLHYQLRPFAQSKLVRVTQGEVLDVVVDIRQGSKTYGQKFSVILSAENKKQMLVPQGFAHAFITLSDFAVFNYKCDNFYDKESEGGIHPLDPTLNIDWGIPESELIISDKDKAQPLFGSHRAFE